MGTGMADHLTKDRKLSDAEWLEVHRHGGRVLNESSHFKEEKDIECDHHPQFRTIVCTSDRDVVECSRCGWQREVPCNFDEEYS